MSIKKPLRLIMITVVIAGLIGSGVMPVEAASKTPSKVTGVKVTAAADTSITLSWSKAKNTKKYEVQYRLSSAKKWSSKKTDKRKITIKGLKANKTYLFRVRALNGTKKGTFSKAVKQKTYIRPPVIDAGSIYASSRDKKEIKLRWKPTANTSWYEISAKKLNSKILDIQNSDYDENSKPLTQYTTRIAMRPNTWYEFRIRSVNAKTGRFPALKSKWSDPFYACTLDGDRLITGTETNGIISYEFNDIFVIGSDDVYVPETVYERYDPTENYYEGDVMYCKGVTFPENFTTDVMIDGDYISSDEVVNGKTYVVGDEFDGETIQSISVGPQTDNENSGSLVLMISTGDFRGTYFTW